MYPLGYERLLHIRFTASQSKVISAYALTLYAPDDEKDIFFQAMENTLTSIPKSEHMYILGDLNSRVGSDSDGWLKCMGPHGVGIIYDNGQRLLELCSVHGLCVTNTYFSGKDSHKLSWRYPRSKRWHQLDLCITRRSYLKLVLNISSYHSADCNTDTSLVVSKVKLMIKKMLSANQQKLKRINTKLVVTHPTVSTSVKLSSAHMRELEQVTSLSGGKNWERKSISQSLVYLALKR
jgi:hypothetical protein